MSEVPENQETDELRQHSEDPAEGADTDTAAEKDVPREHPEGATEG